MLFIPTASLLQQFQKKAFYALPVKDNNPELAEQIQRYLTGAIARRPECVYTAHTIDKGHGRLERREIRVVDSSTASFKIPGIQQVAQITRERTNLRTNKTTIEKVFLITNLSVDAATAEELLWMNRFYWQIENGLHYHKDLVFGEDRSTIRTKHGPANMATLRNFAIGLLLSNDIGNIKRCVDNLKHNPLQLLRLAA